MEPLTYIPYGSALEELTVPCTAVDVYGVRWLRVPSGWVDDSLHHRTSGELFVMRGPIYLLPEGFTGELNLDDLSEADPGDAVLDCQGDRWIRSAGGRCWDTSDREIFCMYPEQLLAVYGPLLPAPRYGATIPPPVPAMEAAARQEEARPVGFWRRLWNGLVWG